MIRYFPKLLPILVGLGAVAFANRQPSQLDVYQTGLAIWRTPDKLGRACASCHSPDGIELAAYGYDEATLERRALPHQGAESARKLGVYIVALRQKLGLKGNLDPMTDRPLQPGGQVLPGKTAEERDRAFALTFNQILPSLMGNRISTIGQAKTALAEVMKLDPAKVRVGIDLNRLSEDKFHGDEHASLAHWIPDEAPLPYSPELERAQSNYLSDPSDSNLQALVAMYSDAWSYRLSPSKAIALGKARSLLVYQHYLRTGRMPIQFGAYPDSKKAPANPFWEIGNLARIYTNAQTTGLSLPPDVLVNKTGGPSLKSQMRDMRVPWLWLGWIADPGLQHTSFDARTRYADWFSQFLLDDGPYPAHASFMLSKKIAMESYDHGSWASVAPQHLDLNFSWVLRDEHWRQFAQHDATYRAALYGFLCNSFRMYALLQADEIAHTGKTYLREPIIQQLTAMRDAVATMQPSHIREDAPIFDRALDAIRTAKFVPR